MKVQRAEAPDPVQPHGLAPRAQEMHMALAACSSGHVLYYTVHSFYSLFGPIQGASEEGHLFPS